VRWLARWYDPSGKPRAKSFDTKRDAATHLSHVRSQIGTGTWIDPKRGEVTLRSVWGQFESDALVHVRPTTRRNYRAWVIHANALMDWPVNRIGHSDIQRWVASLSSAHGPETVRAAYRVVSLVLDYAVRTGHIHINPAKGCRLPPRITSEKRSLTMAQVTALAAALGPQGHDHVLVMALAGLRWSEVAGLRHQDIDTEQALIHVRQGATEASGNIVVGPPKSKASVRTIAIPQTLNAALSHRIALIDNPTRDTLVFPNTRGTYDRVAAWRKRCHWNAVVADLDLAPLTPHSLRHTYASLARAAGADVRLLQVQMGHADPGMTLRVYSHLFPSEGDKIAAALDALLTTPKPTTPVLTAD